MNEEKPRYLHHVIRNTLVNLDGSMSKNSTIVSTKARHPISFKNERLKGESFSKYKLRRKQIILYIKAFKNGVPFRLSKNTKTVIPREKPIFKAVRRIMNIYSRGR